MTTGPHVVTHGPSGAQARCGGPGGCQECTDAMHLPVRCRCGAVYDLGSVTVTARYTDCSMWRTPCCDIVTDDRLPGWGGPRTYEEIDKHPSPPERRPHGMFPWEG